MSSWHYVLCPLYFLYLHNVMLIISFQPNPSYDKGQNGQLTKNNYLISIPNILEILYVFFQEECCET